MPHDVDFVNEIDRDFGCVSRSSVDTSAGILRGRPYGGLAIMWRKSTLPNVTLVDCKNDRYIAVKINLDGRNILVFSVYMPCDHRDNLTDFTNCLAGMNAVIDDNNIEAAFILGDFNAHPTADFGDELFNFCSEQNMICADVRKLGIDSGTFTFMCEASGSRRWLDHCVTTGAAWNTISSIWVDNNVRWSDHFPLYVVTNIAAVAGKALGLTSKNCTRRNILWNNRNIDQINEYGKYCSKKLNNLYVSSHFVNRNTYCDNNSCDNKCTHIESHKTAINKLYNDVINILQQGAITSSRYRSGARARARQVPGWNLHVRESHAQARLYYKWWIDSGKPTTGYIYTCMLNSRKKFKSKLKECQLNEEKIKMDILAASRSDKNFVKFWNSTKKLNHKQELPTCVNNSQDQAKIANMFANHFKVQPLPVSYEPDTQTELHTQHEPIDLSAKEVASVIRKMKRGKSPGHDGLSVEHILYAGDRIYSVLSNMFNLFVRYNYIPDEMMRTSVVPIIKNKTGDLASLSNYRPISLGTIMGKILERLLQPELTSCIELDDAQFGFRAGVSTESAIFSLKHAVSYYKSRDTSVYACFLDLSRAFDLVNYDILWHKLRRSKVPTQVVDLLGYWYENQINNVRWGDAQSNDFRLDCGVRQGGLTSPDLFNHYINDLIVELRSTNIGCHIGNVCVNNLSYADDMVLLSPSINGLRRLIAICERFSKDHGLKYNVLKTEMVVFRAGKGPDVVPPVYLYGSSIRVVKTFKYLGHVLTETLCDDADIERERRALAVRCNMLARRFAHCTREVKLTLFNAFCQTFYTCPLWVNFTKKAYNTLRVQYNDAFRILFRLPRYCSAKGMFADAGVRDFYAVMRTRIASLWGRLRDSQNSILRGICEQHACAGPFFRHWLRVHLSENGKL